MSTVLPLGWCDSTLGALSEYITSGSRDWSSYYASSGALFIRTQDINKNRIADLGSIARVVLPSTVEGKRSLVRQGDVLITITGANVGRCAIVLQPLPEAYVSQSVALVRLRLPSMARYLHYHLLAPAEGGEQTWFEANAYGMGRPVLSLENVRSAPIRLAPTQEQDRISDKLDTVFARVDACRERLARVAPLLKRFRKSVVHSAMSGQLTPELESGTWRHVRLEDVSTITSGVGFPPLLQGRGHGDFPFAKVSDISRAVLERGGQIDTASNWVSVDDLKGVRAQPIPRNSTVFAKIGEGLKLNRRALTHVEMLIDNNCMAVSPDASSLRSVYLYLYMQTVDLGPLSIATAVPSVRRGDIAALELALPGLDEQTEIVRRVETLLAFADRLEARLTQAQTSVDRLTPSLLAKAFRGELVPQDPADEPAAELLKRLAAQRATVAAEPGVRQARRARVPRVPKKAAAMTKSRQDLDVMGQPYLAKHLRQLAVPASAEALFKLAELSVADFYKQLAWEVAQGHIKDNQTSLEPGHAA